MTNNGEATVINDRYEIHKRIGRGGMADVFSARDLLLDRQVAVKVLFPEFATDANFVERFRREAQSAASLSHPNIVNVYDWGKFEGTYFIVMEEVQGRTLAEILTTNKQLTSKQAAEIASEVAAALGFAHDNHVAHRDIKPANILIGTNGQVKVADFGIARALNAPTESNLTQVGSVMGTATYFSPEQAQGAQPDPRSDLYSLGIVMYEMVAGRPPFTGENPVSIAYKQVHDSPQPLVQIVADVPRSFEAIVAKLLAKDPKMRYPSAAALRDDLRRFRNDEPVQALAAAANARAGVAGVVAAGAVAGTVAGATTVNPTVAPTGMVPGLAPRANSVPSPMVEAGYPTGASADAMYYDTNPSRTGWYALGAFMALILLVVGGVLLFQALGGDEGDAEPAQFVLDDYTNRPLDEVIADLTAKNIRFVTTPEESALVAVNFVVRTDPPAGTLILKDDTVEVFFKPDPQLVPVPNVVTLPITEASSLLAADGFVVGTITNEERDDLAENTVISSDPAAGTPALQGTVVNLVVAASLKSVQVPGDVIGMTEVEARALLQAKPFEFVVTTDVRSSPTVPAGTVMEIRPGPGELIPKGSDVLIIVSDGPEPVRVPAVVGRTEAQARNTLTEEGLVPSVSYVDVPAGATDDGRVVAQSLPAGSQVDPGTAITITVGRAITTVPPPTSTTTTTTTPPTTAPTTTTTTTTVAP
ncbi:MAG TPA: Stk1 family PASTA domain-containing Ser/Thr kinase [Ilumatobacteraceae bacterium]|nr:Stk1 family PASTA domain-containing Ser/Thr kinase [Ilumatobacteraceae bacterium]